MSNQPTLNTVRTPTLTRLLAVAVVLPVVLAATLLPATAAAQSEEPPLREGFHFSIGLGSASVSATCGACETNFFENRLNGVSGNLQIGGAINSKLVIAAEAMGWVKNDDPIYRRIAALNLVLLGYPSENSGFFVKGGFGGQRAIVEDDLILVQTDIFNSIVGIGVDIPVGDLILTPFANYIYTYYGETFVNGFYIDEVVAPNLVQAGVALTIH